MSLKTSVGGRDSDSFCSLSEANSFIAAGPDDHAAWNALSGADREYRLKLAAQLMDYFPWGGETVYCGQALCFPRRIRGDLICIPCEVKEVQAYLAYSVIHRGLANRPSSVTAEETGSRVTQVSLGGLLSVSFSGDPVTTGNILDKICRSMHFPAYLKIKKYLAQIRGKSILETDDDEYPTCSTTTTTTTSTTSTTTTTA